MTVNIFALRTPFSLPFQILTFRTPPCIFMLLYLRRCTNHCIYTTPFAPHECPVHQLTPQLTMVSTIKELIFSDTKTCGSKAPSQFVTSGQQHHGGRDLPIVLCCHPLLVHLVPHGPSWLPHIDTLQVGTLFPRKDTFSGPWGLQSSRASLRPTPDSRANAVFLFQAESRMILPR